MQEHLRPRPQSRVTLKQGIKPKSGIMDLQVSAY